MDWYDELRIAREVKATLADVDLDGVWPVAEPGRACDPARLDGLAQRWGHEVDPQLGQFLLHADGWPALLHETGALDVDGLGGDGAQAAIAEELMESLEDMRLLCGLDRSELRAFAVSARGVDVMAIARPGTSTPGRVFWFAGGLIEAYDGFDAWFLAMVEFCRADIEDLRAQHGLRKDS